MRAALLAVAVTAALGALFLASRHDSSATIVGDTDCNGGVDTRDALAALFAYAGLREPPCSGDTDCDGDTDRTDALNILLYAGGIEGAAGPGVCLPIGSTTTPTPEPTPGLLTLAELIDNHDRDGILGWGGARTIAQMNAEVAALDEAHREALPEVVLYTNGTAEQRALLLAAMRDVLSRQALGFYAEIWSYTYIEMVEGGFFGWCNHVWLAPSAYDGLALTDARNVLMHESLHSFDCRNQGPVGALDEGAAIWVTQAGYPETIGPANSWAETTYGTKLFYRDIQNQPDYPLAVANNPTAKLVELYDWLESLDPSGLPWNSQSRLTHCYETYFEQLDRDVDFYNVWLPAVQQAAEAMQADPLCRPL